MAVTDIGSAGGLPGVNLADRWLGRSVMISGEVSGMACRLVNWMGMVEMCVPRISSAIEVVKLWFIGFLLLGIVNECVCVYR